MIPLVAAWSALFWTLVIFKPLAALCWWLAALLFVVVVRRHAQR